MFAIELTKDNLSKIHNLTWNAPLDPPLFPDVYLDSTADWYYISGYVDRRGGLHEYAILPESVLRANFEYDPVKIKTDWDQIVRK